MLQEIHVSDSDGVTATTQVAWNRCYRTSMLHGCTDTPESQAVASHEFEAGDDAFKPIAEICIRSDEIAAIDVHMVEFTRPQGLPSSPKQGLCAWTSLQSLSCAPTLGIAQLTVRRQ